MSEISRRKFIQLTVLGSAVAAAGCDTQTRYNSAVYKSEVTGQYGGYSNRVYPYLNQPDGMQDGVPQYFATACRMCAAGCGLFVRTMGGRAIKIEGNPAHPVNAGKTCARGQASLQHLYNPDRVRFPAIRAARGQSANSTSWDVALAQVAHRLQTARGRIAILADATTYAQSPTDLALIQQFAAKVGSAVTLYSLLDETPQRTAAQTVYGRNQMPAHRLDEADFILSLSGDFLETQPSQVYYNRLFGEFRQGPRRKQGEHGRFVYIGPRMSMTAANADQWIPCNPGTEGAVAQGILRVIGPSGLPFAYSLAQAAAESGIPEETLTDLAGQLTAAGPRALVMGGPFGAANATEVFTASETLNTYIKSECVGFGTPMMPTSSAKPDSYFRQMQALITAMQSGQVQALLILGQPNPIFTLPSALGFSQAIARVPFIAALTPFEDETTQSADVILPIRTFLEDWSDHVPSVIPPEMQGATLQQPIIDPQFIGDNGIATEMQDFKSWMDTRPLGDLLISLAQQVGNPLPFTDMRDAVRKTWAKLGHAALNADSTDDDPKWVETLSQGGAWTKAAPTATSSIVPSPGLHTPVTAPATGTFSLLVFPHNYLMDGRHANLGWLQENPDPMAMAVWNTWIEINMQVAHQMGVRTGDIVRVTTPHGQIELPAIPTPGLHPGAVAMPMGRGQTNYGRNTEKHGINPLTLLDPSVDAQTGALAYSATQVTLAKVRDAKPGYNPQENTLVLVQDRPGGQEPDDIKDLIHTTAKEWKTAKPVAGAPQAEESIFHRKTQ